MRILVMSIFVVTSFLPPLQFCGGSEVEPNLELLRPVQAYYTSPGYLAIMSLEQSVEKLPRKTKYLEKACPSAALSTTNLA
jgi:hypothetical protein